MNELTFGFMDPSRGADANSELFVLIRSLAIKGFAGESICDLSSFADDPIDVSHEVLSSDLGKKMWALRNMYYNSLTKQNPDVELIDIQSFFLYSFTAGLCMHSDALMDPQDLPGPRRISLEDILNRHFPIRGPEWLCNAADSEMSYVADAFCEFQDEALIPIEQKIPFDRMLLADAIAGTLLWAFLGGTYWLKECILEICESYSLLNDKIPELESIYPVKKTVQLIDKDDVQRVLAMRDFYQDVN